MTERSPYPFSSNTPISKTSVSSYFFTCHIFSKFFWGKSLDNIKKISYQMGSSSEILSGIRLVQFTSNLVKFRGREVLFS